MKVVCFGDSNTWGYDPRDFFGGPYDVTWPEFLQRKTGWNVCNWGENGREIPMNPVNFPVDMDLLILMLGTNDLLQGREVPEISRRMETFLESLKIDSKRILLVSPPHLYPGTWINNTEMIDLSAQMADAFGKLALYLGIAFVNADAWNVPIAYDGVHFTEEGHRFFAEQIYYYLIKEMEICFKPE